MSCAIPSTVRKTSNLKTLGQSYWYFLEAFSFRWFIFGVHVVLFTCHCGQIGAWCVGLNVGLLTQDIHPHRTCTRGGIFGSVPFVTRLEANPWQRYASKFENIPPHKYGIINNERERKTGKGKVVGVGVWQQNKQTPDSNTKPINFKKFAKHVHQRAVNSI